MAGPRGVYLGRDWLWLSELGGANMLLEGKQKGLIILWSCQTNAEEHHKNSTSWKK